MVITQESLKLAEHCEHLVFIVGMSGAGKTSACNAFSDSGYFVIDNLPSSLAEPFFQLINEEREKFKKCVLLLTIDSEVQLALALELIQMVRKKIKGRAELLFLDAQDDILLLRYNETRRPHPFFRHGAHQGLEEAIRGERLLLFSAKDQADYIIDSSSFTIHDIKKEIRRFLERTKGPGVHNLTVHLMSFGFKYGSPFDCNIIQDVRFLPNPYFSASLRGECGTVEAVRDYVFQDGHAERFLEISQTFLSHSLRSFQEEGRAYAKIGIGCTGGKHRSVAITETLLQRLEIQNCIFFLTHRDISRPTI